MTNKIALVGLDLDGTLLNDNHEITPRNKAAIEAAIAKGCMVIPATGRPLRGVPKEFLEIEGVNYAVTANGATVIDVKTQKPILKYWLSQQQILQAFEGAKGLYQVFDVFIGGVGYSQADKLERAEEWAPKGMAQYMRKSRQPVPNMEQFILQQKEFEKCTMFFADEEKRSAARKIIEELGIFEAVISTENNLELSAKGVHKGHALLGLAEKLGLQPSQVMACGDSENDQEMLKSVGVPVVMGNAPQDIKQLACWVTDTNEQDGVAKAIEHFVLKE